MVLIISLGISAASSTLVGEALGENSIEKAKKGCKKSPYHNFYNNYIIRNLYSHF